MSNILHTSGNDRSDVLIHVAANLRRLRETTGFSQVRLAEAAGVSRRMIVNIEKGDVNVSLNTLDRLGSALGVTLHAFIAAPESTDSARIDERAWTGAQPESEGRLLASRAARQEVELWSWTLAPGDWYDAAADPAGWHNMIVVLEGQLSVSLGETAFTITAGDFQVFSSDRDHAFGNAGDTLVRFLRNVVY